MNIKLFGVAGEIVGDNKLSIDVDIEDAAALRSFLILNYPEFSSIKGFMIAINHEYAEEHDKISIKDEVAIIPPVSGG